MLGPYYIPFAVFFGFLWTLGTTLTIRYIIRRFGKLKQKVAGMAALA